MSKIEVTQVDVERVARAIWNKLREDEDHCDMELEDMSPSHPVWGYAQAALAAMPSTEALTRQEGSHA